MYLGVFGRSLKLHRLNSGLGKSLETSFLELNFSTVVPMGPLGSPMDAS